MPANHVVVAVDGPSGSGKSSVSRAVAERFGLRYLDTGAMYRAVAWAVLDRGVDPADETAVTALAAELDLRVSADPAESRISVDGVDVTAAIREPAVAAAVSAVSAHPAVRARLVRLQRTLVHQACSSGGPGTVGIVAEGRDIGTVVLPKAKLKVFLTADVAARARRRNLEDRAAGRIGAGSAHTLDALAARDRADSTRAVSPLTPAADAVTVDATDLSLPQVIEAVVELVQARFDLPAPELANG